MSNKGKVLVIGASGFVALHCIAELLKVVSWSIPQLIYAHQKSSTNHSEIKIFC